MASEPFEIGDVVQLKSGSPSMTVVRAESGNYFFCQWFEGSIVHQGSFPSNALRRTAGIIEEAEIFGVAHADGEK